MQASLVASQGNVLPTAPTLSTYVNLLGVSCFLLFVAYSVIRGLLKGDHGDLEVHVGRALAASQLPSAFVLIYAGFDPSILAQLSGLNIGLTVAGVVLAWVSVKTMINAPGNLKEDSVASSTPQDGSLL